MYNRYIPQPDGSFHRSRVEDRPIPPPRPRPEPKQTVSEPDTSPQRPIPPKPRKRPEPMGNFLKQLLPKDFDTEDLLIVLLLLLLSGDCREDQNTALLTLVLYLFL